MNSLFFMKHPNILPGPARLLRIIFLIVLSSLAGFTSHRGFSQDLNKQEKSPDAPSPRALVHILDYVARDYPAAVSDGRIVNQSEFDEQLQFASSVESLIRELTAAGVLDNEETYVTQAAELKKDIREKRDQEAIARIARQIRDEVIRETGMKMTPLSWPDLAAGQTLFQTNCAICHGPKGTGNGKIAATLDPKPTNLASGDLIASISPFQVYNTVSMGVEGTSMPAFGEKLSQKEIWQIAFYVKSLKAGNDHPELQNLPAGVLDSARTAAGLENAARLNDLDLANLFKAEGSKNPQKAAAILRLAGNRGISTGSLALATEYLNKVDEYYQAGKTGEARRKAILAYLNGIEPVEPMLRSHAPSLTSALEEKMTAVRGAIENGDSNEAVSAAIQSAKVYINKAGQVMQNKNDSHWFEFLMAASILLREGLEAFLIILAILSVIRATNNKKAAFWVHCGWILAILSGIAAWFSIDWIISVGFGPVHRELMEGGISLIAVVVLLYVGFWLHSKTEITKWKEFIEVRVENMTSGGNLIGLASIAFFAVFREALESVLFLSALTIEGGPASRFFVGGGAAAAIVTILILGAVALRYSGRLHVRKMFQYSSLMLGILAIILAGKGIHSLQEIGWVSVIPIPSVFQLSVIGLYPTLQTLLAQIIILIILILIWNYPKWRARKQVSEQIRAVQD